MSKSVQYMARDILVNILGSVPVPCVLWYFTQSLMDTKANGPASENQAKLLRREAENI